MLPASPLADVVVSQAVRCRYCVGRDLGLYAVPLHPSHPESTAPFSHTLTDSKANLCGLNDVIIALGQDNMERFERLRNRDNEIFEVFKEFFPWTVPLLGKATVPSKTIQVFIQFITNMDFLKTGIFDLCESDNLYAANILYRSMIEHHLRFMYVWFRHLKERTDSAADDYLTSCYLDEAIKYGKSWRRVAKLVGDVPGEDPITVIRRIHPGLVNESAKSIQEKADKFKVPIIMEFLIQNWRSSDAMKESRPDVLMKLLPLYSELCSFVHGGPDAFRETLALGDEAKRTNENVRVAQEAWLLAATVKLLSLLALYQYDKRFGHPYHKIDRIFKKGPDD